MHLKHKFLPLHSAPTPGGPSLSFSLILTQCHALSTYSMCPFHTNSSQKWSSDGAQLGPRGCNLIDERQGGQGRGEGWRKWKNLGERGGRLDMAKSKPANLRGRWLHWCPSLPRQLTQTCKGRQAEPQGLSSKHTPAYLHTHTQQSDQLCHIPHRPLLSYLLCASGAT